MAAGELDLAAVQQAHRDRGERIVADHEAHLHVASLRAQGMDRGQARGGGTDRVHRRVRTATGELDDRGRSVGGAGVDGVGGAEVGGHRERLRVDVDRDGAHPERGGDHDRREADAAAAVHRQPLAGGDTRLMGDGPERGGESTAEARGIREAERLRERHEVHVGTRQRDVLGHRTPPREAGLVLAVAHLLLPGDAARAGAAAEDERDRDAVADLPAANVRADRLDHPCELVAGDVRHDDVGIVALPRVPVAAAHAVGLHAQHDTVARRGGIGDLDDVERSAEGLEQHGAHEWTCDLSRPSAAAAPAGRAGPRRRWRASGGRGR